MLSHKLLKNHAGILLIGDYTSLTWLHAVVHDVNEHSPLISDREGMFLGLAYDLRKAYEMQRVVLKPPKHMPELGMRYGVQLLWPVLLLQQRMLRLSLAYLPHSRKHQAIVHALEAVIEEALGEDFPDQQAALIARWQRIDPGQPGVFEKLDSRGALFSSWTKSERRKQFLALLESFDPMYESLHSMRVRHGDRNLLSPEIFLRWTSVEWPDPRW
jgi:hypothetical protein